LGFIANDVMKEAKKNAASNKRIPSSITEDELSAARVVLDVLKPFANLTDEWQGDGVTSSLVLLSFLNAMHGNLLMNINMINSGKQNVVLN